MLTGDLYRGRPTTLWQTASPLRHVQFTRVLSCGRGTHKCSKVTLYSVCLLTRGNTLARVAIVFSFRIVPNHPRSLSIRDWKSSKVGATYVGSLYESDEVSISRPGSILRFSSNVQRLELFIQLVLCPTLPGHLADVMLRDSRVNKQVETRVSLVHCTNVDARLRASL